MARILVLGSVAQDEVVHLNEPLCEGIHMAGSWQGTRLGGGASCTAAPLALAGHEAMIVGAVGTDEVGAALLGELEANGVDTSQIVRVDGVTTRSYILVDDSGERTIINVTRTREAEPPTRILDISADCIYVRSRALDVVPLLASMAERCLVVAHMPPADDGCRPAHVLVASAADVPLDILASPFDAGFRVAGGFLEWVVITHGAQGATAFGAHAKVSVPARKVSPVDTTGAGDAFAAGLLHALVQGAGMRDALETAAAWGAQATLWNSSVLPPEAMARLIREPVAAT